MTAMVAGRINVRIDRELKRSGDEALLEAGITPSEAIRGLWELDVRLKEKPGALRAALFPKTDGELEDAAQRRQAAVARARAGQSVIEDARRAACISPEAVAAAAGVGDDELYAEALFDYPGSPILTSAGAFAC